ncbi:hypothetical protein HYH02_007434 [Chlamydomonas schloesseri]|uniref:DNA topoisomerase (ATP-hydrolyzing) n=1 Tax=Chlamydomonas schloesseri TaxID=2026947 RepID=A0A835WH50_9CHLO|nr:hypothetical protein HYH02_007434 [Chlamydomonas schloesseri]|eukprot:KAG2447509.1 hypothetical protein HYH02_007434 [Chlamydomonas schloesseri]
MAFTFEPSSAVLARIESLAEALVTELAEGRLPPLRLPSAAAPTLANNNSNTSAAAAAAARRKPAQGTEEADPAATAGSTAGSRRRRVAAPERAAPAAAGRLGGGEEGRGGGAAVGGAAYGEAEGDAGGSGGGATNERSLLGNQGAGALAYARVVVVLDAVHNLLRQGRTATQRDLYYTLLRPPLFVGLRDVNAAVADAAALLAVPRAGLGLTCAGRGAVAGCLRLRDGPAAPWLDCTTAGPAGRPLPGDLSAIGRLGLQLTAGYGAAGAGAGATAGGGAGATAGAGVYLVVVEKDAVFQRLAEDRLWEALPCVLVTAKGVPDIATRAFASRLAATFPGMQPLGLVDFNPAGVVILATYKYGSDRLGLEGRAHPLPRLRWLGVRGRHLAAVAEQHLQRLTPRDEALIRSLRGRLSSAEPGWVAELDAMEAAGYKGDIEALYHAAPPDGMDADASADANGEVGEDGVGCDGAGRGNGPGGGGGRYASAHQADGGGGGGGGGSDGGGYGALRELLLRAVLARDMLARLGRFVL